MRHEPQQCWYPQNVGLRFLRYAGNANPTYALSREDDIEVMVINPKAAHNFAKALMTRSKTDAIDAENLAIYAERMPFEAWERPADECIGLRANARRIAALNKQKTQTKNQLHALESTVETPALVIEQTEQLIDILDAQIKTLRDSALNLIHQNEGLEQTKARSKCECTDL